MRIDGTLLPKRGPAGHGTQRTRRDVRNSSFVHGRLSLGDRHIVEVLGTAPVKVVALDCKIPPDRAWFPAGHSQWQGVGLPTVEPFASAWGAPFGDKSLALKPGMELSLETEATDVAIAYVDERAGGTLVVSVDGKERLRQPANQPFVDSDGVEHFIENRRGIRNLAPGRHRVVLRAESACVKILGMNAYDRR